MKAKHLQYTVPDLQEGKEYAFRVKAFNESAEGPTTELTLVAKDQIGMCFSIFIILYNTNHFYYFKQHCWYWDNIFQYISIYI